MGKSNPTVSVIIPTYNRAHLIGRAVRSVRAQTFQDFELILVDDASTDNTEQVVKSFSDPRIRYLQHEANLGGSAARNTGIRAACGDYIAFLDSDDEWLPEKVEKQVNLFQRAPDHVGMICTGFIYVFPDGSIKVRMPLHRGHVYQKMLRREKKGFALSCTVLMLRRDALNHVGGFDATLQAKQDYDLWLRISKSYYIDFIPEALARVYHTTGDERISLNLKHRIEAAEKVIHKYAADLQQNRYVLAKHLRDLGIMYCQNYEFIKGREQIMRSIQLNPVQPTAILYFLSSFSPLLYQNIIGSRWYNLLGILKRMINGDVRRKG